MLDFIFVHVMFQVLRISLSTEKQGTSEAAFAELALSGTPTAQSPFRNRLQPLMLPKDAIGA